MVKKRGSKESQPAGDDKRSTSPASEVVVGKASSVPSSLGLPRKKLLLAAVAVIALVVAVVWLVQRNNRTEPATVHVVSQQQALEANLQRLLSHPPASGASKTEKAAYYDSLARAQEDLGKYQDAVQSFNTRKQVTTDGLTYLSYYAIAQDYCKISDKSGARSALAQARKLMPAVENLDEGYSVTATFNRFNNLAKECGI